MSEVRFTRHALEKFGVLEKYGFRVSKEAVIDAIRRPIRVDRRDGQLFALKTINSEYALRIVYEERNDIKLVITFYPVRRDRYGV